MGVFQGHVTLSFLKVEAQNLVSWKIAISQYFISIISCTDTL